MAVGACEVQEALRMPSRCDCAHLLADVAHAELKITCLELGPGFNDACAIIETDRLMVQGLAGLFCTPVQQSVRTVPIVNDLLFESSGSRLAIALREIGDLPPVLNRQKARP